MTGYLAWDKIPLINSATVHGIQWQRHGFCLSNFVHRRCWATHRPTVLWWWSMSASARPPPKWIGRLDEHRFSSRTKYNASGTIGRHAPLANLDKNNLRRLFKSFSVGIGARPTQNIRSAYTNDRRRQKTTNFLSIDSTEFHFSLAKSGWVKWWERACKHTCGVRNRSVVQLPNSIEQPTECVSYLLPESQIKSIINNPKLNVSFFKKGIHSISIVNNDDTFVFVTWEHSPTVESLKHPRI